MRHHIQKAILDTLATSHTRRYGALKPVNLDGNVFGYHLKSLLQDRYVVKLDTGDYQLTPTGKNYIVNRYEDPLLQAHSIMLIVVQRNGQWLMRERLVQPLLGMAGFVHGEPIASEDVAVTARRRLVEKTGIDMPLTLHSSGLITIQRGDVTESFSHALVLTGQTDVDTAIESDTTGRNFWAPASNLTDETILPSCNDLVERITHGDATPFNLHYTL